MQALIFALEAPLAAFGDLAVGEVRPAAERPARSAILGLLACAMGIPRGAADAHDAMEAGYDVASLALRSGDILQDYHTAQVPPARRNRRFATRREELQAVDLKTILSRREYRQDTAWRVLVRARDGAPYTLDALAQALRHPAHALYVGRRACPMARPPHPLVIEASDLGAAFTAYLAADPAGVGPRIRPRRSPLALYADEAFADCLGSGLTLRRHLTRRDGIAHRPRWQFTPRTELAIDANLELETVHERR